jgi:hypothetical protein
MTHRLGNGRNEIAEIFPRFARLMKEFGLNTSFSKENSEREQAGWVVPNSSSLDPMPHDRFGVEDLKVEAAELRTAR